MKTITRTITITIDRCNHCPYFVNADLIRNREWCKYHDKNLTYDIENHCYSIPDWCEVEKNKGDGQHTPRNFEG